MSTDERKKAQLVEENLRLVVQIAKRFALPADYAFLDVVDAGKVGFMKAVDAYVAPAGPKISSGVMYMDMMDGSVSEGDASFEAHAAPFIRAEMQRAVDQRTTAATRSAEDAAMLERIERLRAFGLPHISC